MGRDDSRRRSKALRRLRNSVRPTMEWLEVRRLLSATLPMPVQLDVVHDAGVQVAHNSQPAAKPSDQPVYSLGDAITAAPGDTFEAEATVTSSTDFTAPLYGTILAQLNLSNDDTWYNGPGLIGQATNYVFLEPGQSTSWSVTCTIPAWVRPGTYNLVEWLDLDDTNSVSEQYSQVNNVVTVKPALSGTFTGGIPSSATSGDTISPVLQITDPPGAANVVNGNETTNYYLSTSADFSGTHTLLGQNSYTLNLNAGASTTESHDLTIPSDTSSGTYYLIAEIDATGSIEGQPGAFVVSGPITVGEQLVFSQQPTDTPGGAPISEVTVDVEDADGNIDTSAESNVILQIDQGPGGTLGGTLTERLINGEATFDDLSLGTAGNYTLKATDDHDTAGTSNAFNIGPIELAGKFIDGTSNGPVSIGLTPTNGAAFVPLLQVTDGWVTYGDEGITAFGSFASFAGNPTGTLFTGNINIQNGATGSSAMTVTSEIQIAGQNTTLSGLNFAAGPGGTTNDSVAQFSGGFNLPDSLGNLPVSFGDQVFPPLILSGGGLGWTTGVLPVHNTTFSLAGALRVSAKDMSFQYTSGSNDLRVSGDFTIGINKGPQAFKVDLNLAGPDNYIDYNPTTSPSLKMQGSLTYSSTKGLPVFGNWFSIIGASLTFDTVHSNFTGSVTIQAAGGKTFSGIVQFLDGELNLIQLTGKDLNIPLGPDGLFLQTVGGTLNHLADTDPSETEIDATLGISYGPQLRFRLPPQLGGGQFQGVLVEAETTTAVQIDDSGHIDDIADKATITLAGGLATGTDQFDVDLDHRTFSFNGSLSSPGNILTFKGAMEGDAAGHLTGSETGTANISVPLLLHLSISAGFSFALSVSPDLTQSYFEVWGSVSSNGASRLVGAKIDLAGDFRFLNASELSMLAPPSNLASVPAVQEHGATNATGAESQAFLVPASEPYILLTAAWDNASLNVPFEIVASDGTTYFSSGLPSAGIEVVSSSTDSTSFVVDVNAPEAGTWQVVLPNPSGLGTVSFDGFAPTASSSVAITAPSSNVSGGNVEIDYSAIDPNPGAQVSLFYDSSGSGFDGTLIASGLPAVGDFVWPTANVQSGVYSIYAAVLDDVGIPEFSYGTGTVNVNAPAKLAFGLPPIGGISGTLLNPVTVVVEDGGGNEVFNDASAITLTVNGGVFADGQTTETLSATDGVATFDDLVMNAATGATITATDGALTPAVSSSFIVTQTTALSVASDNPSTTYGQLINFTAIVTPADGSGETGTIQFMDGGAHLGSPVPINNGIATYATSTLTAGSHSITAVYSGDSFFAGSSSLTFAQTIVQAAPTSLNVAPVNITYGTKLLKSQLVGDSASVPGIFSYTSAAGVILHAGNGQIENITFTPTDTADFTTTSSNVAVNVARATVTPTLVAANKRYDGTTADPGATIVLHGVVPADVGNLTASGAIAFVSSGAGTSIAVSATGIALSGAASGDYTLSSTVASATANITAVNTWAAPVSGDWDTASNWSLGHVPLAAEDAVLPAGNYTVTHSQPNADAVNSITSNVAITLSAGSIRVATTISLSGGSLTLSGGTLIGGAVMATGGAELVTTPNGGTLDGVTIGAGTTLDSTQGTANVVDGLTLNGTALLHPFVIEGDFGPEVTPGGLFFDGSQTLGGTGTVTANDTADPQDGALCGLFVVDGAGPATLTVGPGMTIHGGDMAVGWATYVEFGIGGHITVTLGSTDSTLVNDGNINADVPGKTITVPNLAINQGAMTATGGALLLSGSWTNSGIFRASASGTVNLGGNLTTAALGTFNSTGGTIAIVGTLDNTGNTLALTAASGSLTLGSGQRAVAKYGTIRGGTITSSGGAELVVVLGTLDGVTADANLDLGSYVGNNWSVLTVLNGLTLNASLLIGDASGDTFGQLYFGQPGAAAGSLNGTGTVVFGGDAGDYSAQSASNFLSNNSDQSGAAGTLTIGAGITIDGQNGYINDVYSSGSIVNRGTIDASVAGGIVTVLGSWANSGTLEATHQGTLNLGGVTAALGTFNSTGGTIAIVGTLDNTGNTLALTAASGSLTLGSGQRAVAKYGTIRGGTITSSGGAELVVVLGTLDGVTADANLDLGSYVGNNWSVLTVLNGLTLNASLLIGDASGDTFGQLYFGQPGAAAGSLNGTGTVVFGGDAGDYSAQSASNFLSNNSDQSGAAGTLTIGAGITIDGQNGYINDVYSSGSIVNRGTIDASVAGGIVTVLGSWANSGTLEATHQGTLNLGGVTAALGTFNSTGGTIAIVGTLDNTGNTLALTAASGSLTLGSGQRAVAKYGTIRGGTITSSGGAELVVVLGTLDGVTADANLDLGSYVGNNWSVLTVLNGLTLNASLLIGDASGDTFGQLYFGQPGAAAGSLNGAGTVVFGGNAGSGNFLSNNSDQSATAGTLTIGAGITIDGQNGYINDEHSSGSIVNRGIIDTSAAGGIITLGSANNPLTNSGMLETTGGGDLLMNGPLMTNGFGGLASTGISTITLAGSLIGNTTNAAGYSPLGTVHLNGAATAAPPQLLETMSADLGGVSAAYTNNFAYGALDVGNNNYVRLVDQFHNSIGTGSEAVYAVSVSVPAGSTLDLNGLHFYAGSANVQGSVLNGFISLAALPAAAAAVSGNGQAIGDRATTTSRANNTNFGSVTQNTTPIDETFTIANNGIATLTVGSVTLPAGFTLLNAPPAGITAHSSGSFTVRMTTANAGTFAGNVSFATSDALNNPFVFNIAGTVIAAAPVIGVNYNGQSIPENSTVASSSTGTDFGNTLQGGAPPVHTFTINNSGNAALTLGTISVPAGFSLLGSPAASVAAGGTTSFTIGLGTAALGTFSGMVSFSTNAPGNNPFAFQIAGSVIVPPPATISGTVFADSNGNGSFDVGESGILGVMVYLDANGNGVLDSGEATTQTNVSGVYSFPNISPGIYSVQIVLPAGWTQTSSSDMSLVLSSDVHISGMDFGIQGPPVANLGNPAAVAEGSSLMLDGSASSELGGSIVKYEWDTNYNGTTFVARATGISVPFSAVGLDGPSTRAIALRVTDAHGATAITTGNVSIANAPPTATFSSGADVALGSAGAVSFASAADPSAADVSAGFKYSYDFSNDGVFEISNSTSASASVPASYLQALGTYTIHGRITDKDGGSTDYTTTIQVLPPSSASGTVFGDVNGNGNRDAGETAVAGVTVFLDSNGNHVLDAGEFSATSDASGNYSFTSIPGGTYSPRVSLPPGWIQTDTTSDFSFTFSAGVQLSNLDFGVHGPPLPNLGGPYSVAEGASLTLDASASSEVGGAITSYEWDTNYNGTTFVARATGVSIPFSAVGLDGPSTRNIALRITDSHGATAISAGSVAITNAAPTATFTSGGSVTQGNSGSVSFTNSTDPSPADVTAGFKYSYDFNNDGTFDTVDSSTTSATVASSYLSTTGSHTIKGRIKDKDGGFTDFSTTIQVNAPITGTITGTVYNDANGNGIKDSGEAAVSGQKMFLDLNRDAVLQSTEPTFTTGANGVFTFSGLAAGTYRVRMIQLSGYTWTAPTSGYYEVAAAAGQTVTTKDYLEKKTAALTASPLAASPTKAQPKATISGTVFHDANANGKHDSKESGLSGWIVYIDSNNNGKLDDGEQHFTTGADGKYKFTVNAGSYLIREVLNKGFVRTATSANGLRIQAGRGQTIGGKDFADH